MQFVETDKPEPGIAPSRQPFGQCRDGVVAVATEPPMIAVVQNDNIASVSAAQAADHRSGRLRLPVPRYRRPRDHALPTTRANHALEQWTAKTVWRTHPARGLASRGFDGVVAESQLAIEPVRRQKGESRVRLSVVADGVTSRHDFGGERRDRLDVRADQEESRASVVAVEQIEQAGSDSRVGAVIKSDRHHGRITGVANRWSK